MSSCQHQNYGCTLCWRHYQGFKNMAEKNFTNSDNLIKCKRLFVGGLYNGVSKNDLRYFVSVACIVESGIHQFMHVLSCFSFILKYEV